MTYTVADHLLDRLAEAGVRHLFGVPGDFTLAFLDHVEAHPSIEWVGCANELGAGYAADGYARLGGLGALSTTFGVGELSAIGAVAGSYAEHVPVLHVVGAPTTAVQAAGRATHHTLGDGDFGHFSRMTAEVTAAQAVLSAETATEEIDRVITAVLERRLPGYLVIPADVGEHPASPPTAPLPQHPGVTDPRVLARFRDEVEQRVAAASTVSALADEGIPHATLLWGRRVVDESAPAYLGSYVGAASSPAVREGIEQADLLMMAGVQFTDLTSGFFSQHLDASRTIEIRGEHARIGDDDFRPLAMGDALDAVADVLAATDGRFRAGAAVAASHPDTAGANEGALSQTALWREVTAFLRDGDTVLADQGTSFYGMAGHRLPHGVVFGGQPLWAAIGFTLPALLGAALARPERRPVLLIGDGAAQLTIAELGTLLRHRIPAVIVVVDNDGYTVERVIHGLHEEYNDIARWDWTALLAALDPTGTAVGVKASTVAELTAALTAARDASGLTLIQAVVPSDDVPPVLRDVAAAAASANVRH
jgi:indolepyruvate decarboxylase